MAVRFDVASTRDAAVLLASLAGVGLIYLGRRLHVPDRAVRWLDDIHPQ